MSRTIILFLLLLIPFISFSQISEKSLNNQVWQFRKHGDREWLPAAVPGTVHTDLLENKLIPDPFYGDNEKQLQWIENEEWEYKTTFDVSKKEFNQQHIELQLDGLDTYANVYINDSLLLSADNMFRVWNIDVKKLVRLGENKLKIVFKSAVKKGKQEATKLAYTLPGDEKIFTRKAQYQYGWDFGPRLVTSGIYKDVKLVFWNMAKIENVEYKIKSLNDNVAELEFDCEINSDKEGEFTLSAIRYFPGEGSDTPIAASHQSVHLKKGVNNCVITHSVKNPQRWWCNGLGNSFLYPFRVQLLSTEEEMDVKYLQIGLRTIELVKETDSIGKSFYFKLNGVPVFMKGANYIPPDNFLPRVTKTDYEKIVDNAVDANMNMLRVWGGGVYADDAFYDACDKKGILVWQDFMFACAMYPGDDHFINNVSEEIKQQVIRLRNHPSLALWCGNNEIDEGWKNWGWQKQYNYSKTDSIKIWNNYTNLFQKTIPDIVSKNDSQHGYISSSPQIGWGQKESLLQGDSHYWGVWWGMETFDMYKQKVGRFVSEYGFQGMPDLKDLFKIGVCRYKPNSDNYSPGGENDEPWDWKINSNNQHVPIIEIDSTILKAHQKHPTGYQTINTYMGRDYIVTKDFDNYVYVSQLLQAEGMKTAIEAHRRAKPYCMGSLYWQLNDCWSGISWSSVDYYNNWKASYYQAKRSYENLLVSMNEEDNQLKVYIVNDGLKEEKGILEMKLIKFNGTVLWNKTIDVSISPNSSSIYFKLDKSEFKKFNFNQVVLNATLTLKSKQSIDANYYFVKPKDLALEKPEIEITPLLDGTFEIVSNTLAKDVFIALPNEKVKLSDNYFDLLPNKTKVIKLIYENPHGVFYEEQLRNLPKSPLLLKSLYDSLND